MLSHIYTQDNDLVSQPTFQKSLQSDADVKFSTKTISLNTWMEHICLRVQPFHSVEDESLRRGLGAESISVNTVLKYMELMTRRVELFMSNMLLSKFSLVLDGGSHNDTHCIAIFASFSNDR